MDIHREPGIASTAIHIQIRARQLISKSALICTPNSPSPTLPFVQLTKDRSNEIAQAIRDGIIDDPSARRTLDRAIDIIGTCLDFCSHYEKIERHLRNEVKRPEMACFTSPSFVPRALILVWRSPVRTRSPITVGWSRRLRVRTISTRRNYPRTSDRLISSRSIYRFHLTTDPLTVHLENTRLSLPRLAPDFAVVDIRTRVHIRQDASRTTGFHHPRIPKRRELGDGSGLPRANRPFPYPLPARIQDQRSRRTRGRPRTPIRVLPNPRHRAVEQKYLFLWGYRKSTDQGDG